MRGTLIVSRNKKLFPFYKAIVESLGFRDVQATGEEFDALNMLINEVRPRFLLVESDFYGVGTPIMMGHLLKAFSWLNIVAVSTSKFPDDIAVWFYWHGVQSYVNFCDGVEEFYRGLKIICSGEDYVSPGVQKLIDLSPEWPDVSLKSTENQKEVLMMLCNALPIEDMESNLQVGKRTIEYYIKRLSETFHAHSREELIKIAHCMGIVNRNDLCFMPAKGKEKTKRKKKGVVLPAWAKLQMKVNKEQGAKKR